MTKEQEKAIEVLNKSLAIGDFVTTNWVEIEIATRTVLNLIQTQQEEIEKKDKIIDLMADYIDFDKIELNCSSLCVKEDCQKECTKQYFERKITSNKQIQ